jgi:hypothetical protein
MISTIQYLVIFKEYCKGTYSKCMNERTFYFHFTLGPTVLDYERLNTGHFIKLVNFLYSFYE